MEIKDIKKLSLEITHTKDSQIPDDSVLHRFFNLARKNVIMHIIQEVGESFYYDSDFIDAEADRPDGKYTLPSDDKGRTKFAKYNGVFIRRSTSDKYVRAIEVDPNAPGFNWDRYLEGTTEAFFISCNNVFVAPQFTDNVLRGIKITGILAPQDLPADASESLLAVPTTEHEVIAWAMAPYIYKYRGKIEEALTAQQEQDLQFKKMVERLTDRVSDDFVRRTPDVF